MADPVSIAGLVLSLGGVIKLMLDVATSARNAPNGIADLRNELLTGLFAIKGTLEVADNCTQFSQSPELTRILYITKEAVESLHCSIVQPRTPFQQSLSRLRWGWRKDELAQHVSRIERIKTWLIVAMTTDNLSHDDNISLQMTALSLAMKEDRETKEAEMKDSTHTKLLQRLAPVGPDEVHGASLSCHHSGTSLWFIQGPIQRILNMKEDCSTILWLKGKSGSGKTTLLAHLIEYLQMSSQHSPVLSFYCSYDVLASQDAANVLGSFLKQLYKWVPAVMDDITAMFCEAENSGRSPGLSLAELEALFVRHAAAVSSIFIIIDGINESATHADLEAMLYQLAYTSPNLRIIVSSTHDHLFKSEKTVIVLDVEMRIELVHQDIRLYLDNRLNNDKGFKGLSEELKCAVRDLVLQRSCGVFRYVRCQMDHLSCQRTGRGLQRALSDMPSSLNEVYERTLNKIKNTEDRRLLKKALSWLSYSLRPLQLRELNDAIVLEDSDDDINDDMRMHDPMTLIDISNGLLDYNSITGVVSLSHSSIKTFLASDWIRHCSVSDFALDEAKSHKEIMRACLIYLSFRKFSGRHDIMRKETLDRYPLLCYAAKYWPLHIWHLSSVDWNVVASFFRTRLSKQAGSYGAWINILADGNIPVYIVQETQPLYYAASFGFTALVGAILRHNTDISIDAPGGRAGSTPLQVACFRRQKGAAKLLIEAGADYLSADKSFIDGAGPTPLWWMESNGWTDIMPLVKDKANVCGSGIDIDNNIDAGTLSHILDVQLYDMRASGRIK